MSNPFLDAHQAIKDRRLDRVTIPLCIRGWFPIPLQGTLSPRSPTRTESPIKASLPVRLKTRTTMNGFGPFARKPRQRISHLNRHNVRCRPLFIPEHRGSTTRRITRSRRIRTPCQRLLRPRLPPTTFPFRVNKLRQPRRQPHHTPRSLPPIPHRTIRI